ncbi:pyridoxal phosphate-dependent aminotransferase [Actinotalea sp. M2MS4P-6]|uniref:pyridoxal phosphate-dependent aminotransferase n=1 Tax=Actinotalea sp. M2MS4P-6 TaxID=2983762 RepID=UPI0021E469E7|nr:pyridoxal phosphate-dependent aminotransferase [Actinotalea sp. M2MS4P-6]MCV2393524.1 pyridoxal phosphate-dependent aminotransferase [Actinotalea sp. M2MS4P-6]
MERWQQVARAAGLVGADGVVRPTVFAEMSALAVATGAINLGQGFPDTDGPAHVREAAVDALRSGRNQYPPGGGEPLLRAAIATHQARYYGTDLDPATQVLVTTGATEAIAASLLALVGPGEEVLTLEPFYDAYAGVLAMTGARHVTVPLLPQEGRFALDVERLRSAVGPATRMILLNTPHNPTGTVLTDDELAAVAALAVERDLLVVTDEVYEHLVFDGVRHVPVATLPGMAGRTLTVSSAGKSLSLTGWKVGWVTGPAALVSAVRTVQQYLTYASGAPFQPAVAAALADDDGRTELWLRDLAASLAQRRDLLVGGLRSAGFDVVVPQGTYFVVADGAPLGFDEGVELCRRLPELAGVVAVPVSAFCRAGSTADRALRSRVRFTFVKRAELLAEAADRLGRLAG